MRIKQSNYRACLRAFEDVPTIRKTTGKKRKKVNQSINNRGTTETSFSQTPYLMPNRWPEGREVEGRKLQLKNPVVSMIKSTADINTEPGDHRPVGKGFTVR